MKFLGILLGALLSVNVSTAKADVAIFDINSMQQAAMSEAMVAGLKWKVGDQADYKISIGGFINGTIHAFVREDLGTTLWMQQDADLGFMGKQKIEVQFDKATGQVLKILANGQEQKAPSAGDVELVEIKEDSVTVPAGTFKCIYAKIKDKQSGEIQEGWLNPQAVPMSGAIKSLGNSQFGQVKQELTKFSFAP